uniref:Uncharacterized protein n=1 Tax=Paenibacillus athensensis TaxID=1967502 RepID=A0A4Y8PX37_9BACL
MYRVVFYGVAPVLILIFGVLLRLEELRQFLFHPNQTLLHLLKSLTESPFVIAFILLAALAVERWVEAKRRKPSE